MRKIGNRGNEFFRELRVKSLLIFHLMTKSCSQNEEEICQRMLHSRDALENFDFEYFIAFKRLFTSEDAIIS
jgi:hypothetical protein